MGAPTQGEGYLLVAGTLVNWEIVANQQIVGALLSKVTIILPPTFLTWQPLITRNPLYSDVDTLGTWYIGTAYSTDEFVYVGEFGSFEYRIFFKVVNSSFLLNGIWWFVRSWSSFFMYLQYCTVVKTCCTCAENKNTRRTTGTRRDTHHGHEKGTYPRASQGRALMC
jgi:hypothetical protein